MLFARLQREGKSPLAVPVDRAADDAPGIWRTSASFAAQETEVRPAGGQRRPERLTIATRRCRRPGAPFARRREDGERGRVHQPDGEHAVGMRPVGERVHFFQHAEEIRLRE